MTTFISSSDDSLTRTFDNGTITVIGTMMQKEQVLEKISVQGDHKTPLPYYVSNTLVHRAFGTDRCVSYGYTDSGNLHNVAKVPAHAELDFSLADLISESEDRALNKFTQIMRARDANVGHDMLVSIFESPELKDLYKQLSELIKTVHQRKFLKLLKRASPAVVAAEYYLLWTFGIEPIISAIQEILTTLNKGIINSELSIFKATSEVATSSSGISTYFADVPFEYEVAASVRTSFQAGAKIQDIEKVLLHQFGLLNPGSAYYATLPFSFVLDWFVNVGGYLNTVEYLASNTGIELTGLFKSQKIQLRWRNTCAGAHSDKFGTQWVVNSQSYGHTYTFQRTLLSSLPNPHLPSFKPSLNGGKVLSLVALLTKFLTK